MQLRKPLRRQLARQRALSERCLLESIEAEFDLDKDGKPVLKGSAARVAVALGVCHLAGFRPEKEVESFLRKNGIG